MVQEDGTVQFAGEPTASPLEDVANTQEEQGAQSVKESPATPAPEQGIDNFLRSVEGYRVLKRGDIVEGIVVRVNRDEVLIDVGAKSDGIIRMSELGPDSPASKLKVGEQVLVYVVQPENREGNIILSLAKAQLERDWRAAEQLFASGGFFESEVIGYNKGGLLVRYGEVRGFVPASQVVELRGIERGSLESHMARMVGKRLRLKIIEINRQKNRLILSETVAEREWRNELRERLLAEIQEGEIRHGRVTGVCDFGAFVDLGGIDGLIHITELSWQPVGHPGQILQVGDEVDVKVMAVDQEKRRIALSLKRTKPEPWLEAVKSLTPGQIIPATITKLASFGAFARVADGVEGLIHISELASGRIDHPKQVVRVGDTVMVRVLDVDRERHRISLSLRQARQIGPAEERSEGTQPTGQESQGK